MIVVPTNIVVLVSPRVRQYLIKKTDVQPLGRHH